MKKLIIFLIPVLLIACSNTEKKTAKSLWKDGQNFRNEKKLKDSISSFKNIIQEFSKNKLAAQAQFQIADIYLNDVKDFEFAIEEFKKVVINYPQYEVSKKSLFMIAYIYNNYLDAYTDAKNYYLELKKYYPEDELIPSVDYELEGIQKHQSTIDSLKTIVNKNI